MTGRSGCLMTRVFNGILLLSILIPSGHTLEEFLARTLGPVLDTIVSASNRPYLSCHVVTRAVEVMVGVLELLVMGTQLGRQAGRKKGDL